MDRSNHDEQQLQLDKTLYRAMPYTWGQWAETYLGMSVDDDGEPVNGFVVKPYPAASAMNFDWFNVEKFHELFEEIPMEELPEYHGGFIYRLKDTEVRNDYSLIDTISKGKLPLAEDRKNKIYISGPMTGITDWNFPAFNAKAIELTKDGWSVLNPAQHGLVEGAQRNDYLRFDGILLLTCEAIYMLPGWEKSEGAKWEHNLATMFEMEIIYQDPPKNPHDASHLAQRLV